MEERTIRGGKKGQQTAQKNRINEEITAQEVRLIDIEGEQAGIQSLKDAQAMADAAGVDLVEISPSVAISTEVEEGLSHVGIARA